MQTRLLAVVLTIGVFFPPYSSQRNDLHVHWTGTVTLATTHVPTPEEILGFVPGDDRKLASWNQVLRYFDALSKASDRVKFESLGKSTMNKALVMATISAPENLAHLDEYRKIQEFLADPRKLGRHADGKADTMIRRGKTIVLITCGIHSTEVGSYLSSMLIAYRLASSNEPEIQNVLRNTIILLVPSLNPDGVDIVKNWYDKTLGTPYEGTNPPELYHKYVGHDNNRDWYAFTQVETQIAVDKIHNVWHPQIVHDIHQQGALGSRLFVPPYMPPVEPNVPRQIVEGYTTLGNFMARELRAQGFKGITNNSTYDAWSPSRAYSHYHGGVRILSETASCKIATPITVKLSELRSGEGYNAQKASANFGPIWGGGEWHLRDITNYMTTAAFLLLRHASENREEWLRRFYEIAKDAVRPRRRGELSALLVLPSDKFVESASAGLFDLTPTDNYLSGKLNEAGIETDYAGPFVANSIKYPGGLLVRMNQPYSAFARAILEPQSYPDLRGPSGTPIQPYDVTAHDLAMLTGLNVQKIYGPLRYKRLGGGGGTGLCPKRDHRLAVYKSYVPSMDEGWTRWVIESASCLNYSSTVDKDLRGGDLRAKFDTIIVPDQLPKSIVNGHRAGTMPPEYTGGLGQQGVKALREFVEQGGTLVCLNRSSDFAIEQFKLPVRDVVADVPETDFFVPGSILRIELDTSNPIALGMPRESIAWVEDSPVFEVINITNADKMSALPASIPASNVRVIARYPANKNPLLSGWLLGGNRIKGKAALVEVRMGKGRIILFGFRPQYRGQSLATYPLFFNAISGK